MSRAALEPQNRMLTISLHIGIFVYRNIADLERIMDYADLPHISKASVVGGGLLGLEAAKAVYDMPGVPDVSIIIRQNYPLNRQLDPSAGELVLRKIEAMGVKVLTQVTILLFLFILAAPNLIRYTVRASSYRHPRRRERRRRLHRLQDRRRRGYRLGPHDLRHRYKTEGRLGGGERHQVR